VENSLSELRFIVIARRLILWTYAVLFVVAGALSGMFFFRTYQEYAQLRRIETESQERLAQAQQRLKDQQRVLDRLRTDPAYVEKVIRRQLRYARPDELIFRFDD
jgi:cell division protein FtsB